MSKGDKNTLVVIGGGAAGFFAAVNAARINPGLNVIILEKNKDVLAKVRVSGGGRCNVTHHCFDPEQLSASYPRGSKMLRWAFETFQPTDTIQWFRERGVELKAEEDGRMFPVTDSSETIINCLMGEARKYGVEVRTKAKVEEIKPIDGGGFQLIMAQGPPLNCQKLIVAAGGFNRPEGWKWLQKLGHSIETPVPSLFTFNFRNKVFTDLAGISMNEVNIRINNTSFTETGPALITHWGMSGPAVLKLSARAARRLNELEYRFSISVNWIHPHNHETAMTGLRDLKDKNSKKMAQKQDHFPIPVRLWERITELAGISKEKRWADLSKKEMSDLAAELTAGTYEIQGKTTYKEEFVTCGGIPLNEINPKTMESRKVPGLHFAGEVLDIDGITGGFNFQAAWTTGWLCAEAVG